MAGLWSHPDDFPLLLQEEERDGDMNAVGPGRSSGFGHVDGEYCWAQEVIWFGTH